jgi:hypothetical protein
LASHTGEGPETLIGWNCAQHSPSVRVSRQLRGNDNSKTGIAQEPLSLITIWVLMFSAYRSGLRLGAEIVWNRELRAKAQGECLGRTAVGEYRCHDSIRTES